MPQSFGRRWPRMPFHAHHAFAALLAFALARPAFAQETPISPSASGRETDGGYTSSGMFGAGEYSASVPLDLPVSRAGLPIPLQVVYGASGVGAAGRGWDVPIAFVAQSKSVARRRPSVKSAAEGSVIGRQQLTLSLFGSTYTMMEDADGFRPHRGGTGLLLEAEGDAWRLHDPEGRSFLFEHDNDLGTSLWVLTSITDARHVSSVDFTYDILPTTLLDGASVATLDLATIEYNHGWEGHSADSFLLDPQNPPPPSTQRCAKNVVTLNYEPTVDPLGFVILDDVVIARTRLLDSIDIQARASCVGALETLRSYAFSYGGDGDNGLPRLDEVTLYGQEGTPEATLAHPVVKYHYGTASRSVPASSVGRELAFEFATTIGQPAEMVDALLGEAVRDTSLNMPSTMAQCTEYTSVRALQDFTGDGRADWVYLLGDELRLATNIPNELSLAAFGSPGPLAEVGSVDMGRGGLSIQALMHERGQYGEPSMGGIHGFNVNDSWRQVADMNGDGRLDIVDASLEKDTWVVLLNTPGSTDDTIYWKEQLIDAFPIRQHLESGGHKLPDEFVPLGRKTSGRNVTDYQCMRYDANAGWVPYDGPCDLPPLEVDEEKTVTEWELRDFNNDGYVDFVADSRPVTLHRRPVETTPHPVNTVLALPEVDVVDFEDDAENMLEVAFDVAGVLRSCLPGDPLDGSCVATRYAFETIEATECGVERWEGGPAWNRQRQACGLQDINGDGVVDRIEEASARLGHGRGFTDVTVSLPGPASYKLVDYCDQAPAIPKLGWQPRGWLDVTADGIVDYVEYSTEPDPPYDPMWVVHVGTGAGFAPPIPMPGFAGLPSSEEACTGDDGHSWDDRGMVDVDGDGRLDSLVAVQGGFNVFRLRGSDGAFGAPAAGRLVAIENGFGGTTSIRYRSAKRDGLTRHQVSFPEIVVDAVETTVTAGQGTGIAPTRFAYGGAATHYDALVDRWVWSGYEREIRLSGVSVANGNSAGSIEGVAQFSDRRPDIPMAGGSVDERVGRYLLAGTSEERTTLVGTFADPWAWLGADVATHPNARAGSHEQWSTRQKMTRAAVDTDFDCLDVQDPYDTGADLRQDAVFLCQYRGFGVASTTRSWRGDVAPPSVQSVATMREIIDVDELGRPTFVHQHNDVHVAEDDVCVETSYAAPASSSHVSSAVATTTVSTCGKGVEVPRVLSRTHNYYDGLPVGQVSFGALTGSEAEVYDLDSGVLLETVAGSTSTYDFAGNPVTIEATRGDDGATRAVSLKYDEFRLAVVEQRVEATGALPRVLKTTVDPLSMIPVSSEDPHGLVSGVEMDGFQRIVRRTVTPPGGQLGVITATEYVGFDGAAGGRSVITTRFVEPVPVQLVAATLGRSEVTSLDALGRVYHATVGLGPDYGNASVVVVDRTFDSLGRAEFEAAPYPESEPAGGYGVTHHYDTQGRPTCSVQGFGLQPVAGPTDVSQERFPTCSTTSYESHRAISTVQSPSSLDAGSPQHDVVKVVETSAIGREYLRVTWQGNTPIELFTFDHDALGNTTATQRFGDPVNGTAPVEMRRRFDSLGRVVWSEEADDARVTFEYDDWSEPVRTSWTDTTTGSPVHFAVEKTYDGLGRPLSEVSMQDGVPQMGSEHTYAYDVSNGDPNHVGQEHLLGRLAMAVGAAGTSYFSYDELGRLDVQSFVDDASDLYVQRVERRFDGAPLALSFWLPDTGHNQEQALYAYDSAGRVTGVEYHDDSGKTPLLTAAAYDDLGRMLGGLYGQELQYEAEFHVGGRRLPMMSRLTGPDDMRRVSHLAYDAAGRETERAETGGDFFTSESLDYDSLGRLVTRTHEDESDVFAERLSYDALGNLTTRTDAASGTTTRLSFHGSDPDRICRIVYDGALGNPASCNVTHDALGRIVDMPTPDGTRTMSYFADGHVQSVSLGSVVAEYVYDPLGGVARLDVTGGDAMLERSDRRFGLIERRDEIGNGDRRSFVERHIPGAGDLSVSRRGAASGGEWIFGAGEARGGRFFANAKGEFLQDVRYTAFGEAVSKGVDPGSNAFTTFQWNGGDRVEALGVNQLGERLYDPRIGRFLSRDPLYIPRTASTTNPYAFAMNDPWNASDPTGLDCIGMECNGPSGGGGGTTPPPSGDNFDYSRVALYQAQRSPSNTRRGSQRPKRIYRDPVAPGPLRYCGSSVYCAYMRGRTGAYADDPSSMPLDWDSYIDPDTQELDPAIEDVQRHALALFEKEYNFSSVDYALRLGVAVEMQNQHLMMANRGSGLRRAVDVAATLAEGMGLHPNSAAWKAWAHVEAEHLTDQSVEFGKRQQHGPGVRVLQETFVFTRLTQLEMFRTNGNVRLNLVPNLTSDYNAHEAWVAQSVGFLYWNKRLELQNLEFYRKQAMIEYYSR